MIQETRRRVESRLCDLCKEQQAEYDDATKSGPWAYMCGGCHKIYGLGIGFILKLA